MKNIDYLPLGTICNIEKKPNSNIMIIGYSMNIGEEHYDYCGVVHPIGVISRINMLFFNHDDIEKIIFEGFKDEEYEESKKLLNIISEKLSNEKDSLNDDKLKKTVLELWEDKKNGKI